MIPDALPLPEPEPSTTSHTSQERTSHPRDHLSDIRHELEELLVLILNKNQKLKKGLPEGILHTDCARALLDRLAVHYGAAKKHEKDPETALTTLLNTLANDADDGIIAGMFRTYANKTRAQFDGRTFADGNTQDVAKIVVRKNNGEAEFPMVHRSAVHAVCHAMAAEMAQFHFSARVQLRSAVRDTVHEAFEGQEGAFLSTTATGNDAAEQ